MQERSDKTSSTIRAVGLRALAAAAFWWCMTEGAGGWALGVPAVVAAVLASLALAPPAADRRISPLGVARFAGAFVLNSVAAGVQVARFALTPRLALRPARISLETTLPPGLPRVLLANTLTLQPGTLAVSLEDARLLLHVLDETQALEPEVRALEKRIAQMLRLS